MAWKDAFSRLVTSIISIFQKHGGKKDVDLVEVEHTIKSHGLALAKSHMRDWLVLLLLAVIEIILYVVHPFHRFVGKDMMTDLKFPMKSETVPDWSVPIFAVLLPISIFAIRYIRRRDVYDLHHSIFGLLLAMMITGVITDALKNGVGRPRPNFFWRCFPDGKEAYDNSGNVLCHGHHKDIEEGYKSFPSAHTSRSFAAMAYLSLYLSGKLGLFNHKGFAAKLCIVFIPLVVASFVAISRIDDYMHHWQDVLVGGLIGTTVAALGYLQLFPSPHDDRGWGTYAYFKAMKEMQSNSSTAQNVTNTQGEGNNTIVNRQGSKNSCATRSSSHLDESLDRMESGRQE